MDWETIRQRKISSASFHYNKNINRDKCKICGNYYLCTCQVNLLDWVEVKIVKKDVSAKHNCPHNCVNANESCLHCYNYNKFKMMVKL